jgi:hypothetical protein
MDGNIALLLFALLDLFRFLQQAGFQPMPGRMQFY